MTSPVRLIFGVHSHQPVGNLDDVFARALEQAYDPFLGVLERHASARVVFHYSGCLFEWLEEHAPSHLDRIAALARAGRIEMLGGGFYEPILPLIPAGDRVGQIRLMARYLRERFGAHARGMWLAERIWEPTLPSTLHEAGVEFTVLDDYHFLASMDADPVGGHYLTEDQGLVTHLFPISERLRYLIPFREPQETIDYLRELGSSAGTGGPPPVAVIVDDGEKFGLWPGTSAWVYGQDGQAGWLERFFTLLEENSGWLTTTTFEQTLREIPPRGRVYLPPGSYMEMGGWALTAGRGRQFAASLEQAQQRPEWERERRFLRGGFFRNFLAKYTESFLMTRRAQLLSAEMDRDAMAAAEARAGLPDAARRDLWRAMCNCGYWHGIFGGLYLPHIRRAVGRHLCRARRTFDAAPARAGGADGAIQAAASRCVLVDVDADGHDEIEIHTPAFGLLLEPACGGALSVLDIKGPDAPLGLTLTRRIETYHDAMGATGGGAGRGQAGGRRSIHEIEAGASEEMRSLVVADDRPRASLVDRFLPAGATPEALMRGEAADRGDFFAGRYEVLSMESPDEAGHGPARVTLSRRGTVDGSGVALVKRLSAQDGRLEAVWRHEGPIPAGTLFAVELNLALVESMGRVRLLDGAEEGRVMPLSEAARGGPAARLQVQDDHQDVELRLDLLPPAEVWHYPVRTVSRSEKGYEANYQGSALLIVWGGALPIPREASIVLTAGRRAGQTV